MIKNLCKITFNQISIVRVYVYVCTPSQPKSISNNWFHSWESNEFLIAANLMNGLMRPSIKEISTCKWWYAIYSCTHMHIQYCSKVFEKKNHLFWRDQISCSSPLRSKWILTCYIYALQREKQQNFKLISSIISRWQTFEFWSLYYFFEFFLAGLYTMYMHILN